MKKKINRLKIYKIVLFITFLSATFTSIHFLEGNIPIYTKTDLFIEPYITHFRQGCNTTFLMSWDDARPTDVYLRAIDLKYGISHTIFAPSYRSYPNRSFWRYAFLLDEMFQGFDVQSHNGLHVYLSRYNAEEQEAFIKWGKTGIEELFGFTPIVFAYPNGDTGGSQYVKKYFTLGRTIDNGGTSWPPTQWEKEGVTISFNGINDKNLKDIPIILKQIFHTPGFQVFKGYSHSNLPGSDYGVSDFEKYETVIEQISGWENVWYTSWGELVAYEIEKNQISVSKNIVRCDDFIEFTLSTVPTLNTDIYNVPITVALSLPEEWSKPTVQIDSKFICEFSLKTNNNVPQIFIDVKPKQGNQRIKIWKNQPSIDHSPPEIANFRINTITYQENWELEPPREKTFSFLRFEACDEDSQVVEVNAMVTLFNNSQFFYKQMKNPIFWNNNSYGRVLWNPNIYNGDVQQISKQEVKSTTIIVKDGLGNIRKSTFDQFGGLIETIVESSNNNRN
ncbi:hypothetical protein [Candidatus Hodarchaeum mangrovi]